MYNILLIIIYVSMIKGEPGQPGPQGPAGPKGSKGITGGKRLDKDIIRSASSPVYSHGALRFLSWLTADTIVLVAQRTVL